MEVGLHPVIVFSNEFASLLCFVKLPMGTCVFFDVICWFLKWWSLLSKRMRFSQMHNRQWYFEVLRHTYISTIVDAFGWFWILKYFTVIQSTNRIPTKSTSIWKQNCLILLIDIYKQLRYLSFAISNKISNSFNNFEYWTEWSSPNSGYPVYTISQFSNWTQAKQ